MPETKIDKYYLNLAGEYRVSAELLKRVKQFAGGVDNVTIQDVEDFENKWQPIVEWCSSPC